MIYKTKIYDLTNIFNNTKSNLVRLALEKGYKVYGIKLEKLKGLIGYEIMPNRRIGTELADVAKRFGLKGILHSDELPGYGISEEEVKKVKEILNCSENDGYILLMSPDIDTAKKVFRLIIHRINEFIRGVPKDTRQANDDGTTTFLRPQPGSERMYPETDHPYIFINRNIIEGEKYDIIIYDISYGNINYKYEIYNVKNNDYDTFLRLYKEGKEVLNSIDPSFMRDLLKKIGYNDKQIENIIWNEYIYDIIKLSLEIDPNTVYYLFFQLLGDVSSIFKEKIEDFDINFIYNIVRYLKDKKIVKNAVPIIYYYYIKEKKSIEDIINEKRLHRRNLEELEKEIKDFINNIREEEKRNLKALVFSNFKYVADSEDIKKVLDKLTING
ncbi:MAG: GAD domain-containing protein [Nanopusillaceae archaeon]